MFCIFYFSLSIYTIYVHFLKQTRHYSIRKTKKSRRYPRTALLAISMFATIGGAGAYVLASPILVSDETSEISTAINTPTTDGDVTSSTPSPSVTPTKTAASTPSPDSKPEPAVIPIPKQEVQPHAIQTAIELFLNPNHNPASAQSVSYTHLDVYKRQVK